MGGRVTDLLGRAGLVCLVILAGSCTSTDEAIDAGSVTVTDVSEVGHGAAMVSADHGVVLAGGRVRAAETEPLRLSNVAVLIRRGSASSERLPDLPKGTWVEIGAAVDDRVYLVGKRCRSDEPGPFQTDCLERIVLHLNDDGTAWEAVDGAAAALGSSSIVRVGSFDGQLAIVPGGSADTLFHLYEPATGEWSRVAATSATPTSLLYCFGPTVVLAYRFDAPSVVSNETVDATDQRRAYHVWGYQSGQWSERHDVDLGLEAGEDTYRPVLCGSDAVAFTAPDRRDAVILSVVDGRIAEVSVPDPAPVPTPNPNSPNFVTVSGRGALVWISGESELLVGSPVKDLNPLSLIGNSMAGGWVDVLQRSPGGIVEVVSVPLPD